MPRPEGRLENTSVPPLTPAPGRYPPREAAEGTGRHRRPPTRGKHIAHVRVLGITQLQAFKSGRMHLQRNTSMLHTKAMAGECRPFLFSSHKPHQSPSATGERCLGRAGNPGVGGLGGFQQTAGKLHRRLEFTSHQVQPVQVAKHRVPACSCAGSGQESIPCSTAAHPPMPQDPASGWDRPRGHPGATGSERLHVAGEPISPARLAAARPQVPSPWGSGKGLPHPAGALPGKSCPSPPAPPPSSETQ